MTTLERFGVEQVEELLDYKPDSRNTKFLKSSHNLWFRFKNYEKNPPFVLLDAGIDPVALVFITFSQRSKYANLYEIVTIEGEEGRGYASDVYWRVMEEAHKQGMQRLKMSCTPSSITWHKRNGTMFWAVDPSGSLRCDVPIFPTKAEALSFRELAVKDPTSAKPNAQVCDKLIEESLESHNFGVKKTAKVQEAIESVGEFWLRDSLFVHDHVSLEEFL
jgi:hypothetical protein